MTTKVIERLLQAQHDAGEAVRAACEAAWPVGTKVEFRLIGDPTDIRHGEVTYWDTRGMAYVALDDDKSREFATFHEWIITPPKTESEVQRA